MRALERAGEDKEAHGEIETLHPGYLGTQHIYYVGTIKSWAASIANISRYLRQGRLRQTLRLQERAGGGRSAQRPRAAFLRGAQIPLLRLLTDRGKEYCGQREHHEYELYLAVENIDHSRTKARHPQTSGICERFHRTIQEDFYATAFRKKLYTSLEELQADLDDWLVGYNRTRPHSGKYCYGKTPLRTFLDSISLAREKMLDSFSTPAAEPERGLCSGAQAEARLRARPLEL